jgi:putative membrane protein
MTKTPGDPSVYFAAERTLLSWARTALSVMGFGFVVARFGLYLRMLGDHDPHDLQHAISTGIGVALVVLATIATTVAAAQYHRFLKTLPNAERPRHYWLGFAFWYAVALSLLGALLAVYLIVWMYQV